MNAEASKEKADSLVAQAKKRLNSWSLFNSSKYEDAAELFEKAANNYKLAKACTCFCGFSRLCFYDFSS